MDDGERRTARPLRVGIDGFNLAMRRGTGVATYARALSQCVAGMGHKVDVLYGMNMSPRVPPTLREIIFFDSLDSDVGSREPRLGSLRWAREHWQAVTAPTAFEVPITGRVLAKSFASRMPSFDRILNIGDLFGMASRHFRRTRRFLEIRIADTPDIMHWTYPLPIRVRGARNVYTIHDVVPLRLPYTTLDNKRLHYRLLAGCMAGDHHVCTVSDASRRDILSFYPQAEGRITNTYESIVVPPDDLPDETVEQVFGLRRKEYFLFFGSIEPKKNVGRILEAYLTSNVEATLVIVGAQAWKSENELRLLRDGNIEKRGRRIIKFDYLPAAMLHALIREAKAVVFPSLYEGFGLPVLEAMAVGTPVLTSHEGSLPEIAGDAALLVDAYDTAAIADGLRKLDSDPTLRNELSARGRQQARAFGMSHYQARISKMYGDLCPELAA